MSVPRGNPNSWDWGAVANSDLEGPLVRNILAGANVQVTGAASGIRDLTVAVPSMPWDSITGKPSTFPPSAHKTTHASGGTDVLTPGDIGAVNKAGDTMTGPLIADMDVGPADTRIYKHLASYKNASNNLTGALKISLPKSWSNTMLRIRIVGYDYSGNSAWEVTVAGYNYVSTPAWYNYSAELRGMAPFDSVRLGHDGTVNCILLGTITTTWQYPHIVVDELIAGQVNVTGWEFGWQISLITDETGIGYIVTPALRKFWHAGNDGAGSGLDADLLDGQHGDWFRDWNNLLNKPSSFAPSAHKSTHASGGTDVLTPADIGAVNKSGDTMTGALQFNDANTKLLEGAGNSVRVQTNSGYLDLGPQNTSYCHIYTDRAGGFYFNQLNLFAAGNTIWHAGNDGSGSGLDADLLDGKHFSDITPTAIGAVSKAGDTMTGALLITTGPGTDYGVASTPGFVLGTNTTNRGFLKLHGMNSGAYGTIQMTTVNLHLDTVGGAMYLNYYDGDAIYFGTGASGVAAKMDTSGQLWYGNGTYKYWHAGNDGVGSGLDADLLDGQHGDWYRDWVNLLNKPASFPPSAHAASHHSGGTDALNLGSIAGTLTDTQHGNRGGGSLHAAATTTSAGFMSAADKSKLDGIQAGAEVNQFAFSNVKVGSTTIAADTKTDTLELVVGANVALTPDATNDKVTIAVPSFPWSGLTGVPATFPPSAHKSTHSSGGTDPLTPTDIGAAQILVQQIVQIGSWKTKTSMPTRRDSLAAVSFGNTIYLVGGHNETGPLAINEMYDQTTDTWTAKASMPTARYGLVANTIDGEKLYAIGGELSPGSQTTVNEEYNTVTNTWTAKSSRQAGLSFSATAVPATGQTYATGSGLNEIYVLGGYNSPYGAASVNEYYNPITNTWTELSSMPIALYGLAAAAPETQNGRIYAIGGNDGVTINAITLEYDPLAVVWTTKANMPTARYFLAAVALSIGKIWAIGGFNGVPLSANEEYDPINNTWKTISSMPTARYNLAAAVAEHDLVYAIGGCITVQDYRAEDVLNINEECSGLVSPLSGIVRWPDKSLRGVEKGIPYMPPETGYAVWVGTNQIV